MGIGIDIVKVNRIKEDKAFLEMVYSPRELLLSSPLKFKKEFFAGRWAAKEAFIKANNSSLNKMKLSEIEVLRKESGAPYIEYQGKIYDNVSISHEREYAIAMVII